ncbi:MAG: Gfo/Idh/MocA family oxidoreductase [Pirellulales bacterium]
MNACRWGILGTAEIAQKNWLAIQLAENASLSAVASRSQQRAAEFVNRCQQWAPMPAPVAACGTYQELLDRDDVDAVYVPLPTGLRHTWLIRAAEAGKHILAEKPAAVSATELRNVLDACRQHNVQFMDGLMFMHSARMQLFRETVLEQQAVGQIKRIATHHAFAAPPGFLEQNIRAHSELEPQGCLGDLGWYSIRIILWMLNGQLPQSVIARLLTAGGSASSPGKVPLEISAELLFGDGVSAHFYCSFLTENQQWVNVGGTKGFAVISDFVLPFVGSELAFNVCQAQFHVSGVKFDMEEHTRRMAVREYGSGHPTAQETRMFTHFSRIVTSGQLEDYWPDITLRTQLVMDACLDSANNHGRPVEVRL